MSCQQLGRSVNYINKGLAALSGPPDPTDVVVSVINDDNIGRLQPETLPISQVANESVETHMQNLRFLQCVKELGGGLRGAGGFFPGCVLAGLQAAGEGGTAHPCTGCWKSCRIFTSYQCGTPVPLQEGDGRGQAQMTGGPAQGHPAGLRCQTRAHLHSNVLCFAFC